GPQVGYAIPSFFFEVGLHTPTTGVVGVIPPAGPGVVIGRTQNFAFTITSGISDQVDTYLEVLNPGNDHQYLYNGAYLDMDCRTESFTVREPPPPAGSGGAPTTETRELCRTRHGPVFYSDPAGGAAFSHASAHRNLELASAAAWLRMGQATNLTEFKTLVDGVAMSFNYNFADNSGNIAYFHAGVRPLRPPRSDPRFPLIGTGGYEWQGVLPKSQMPGIVNPAQGWLTNWNNNPIRGWSSGDVRELWGTEHRVQALQDGILRELAADGKLSVDDVNLVMFQAAKKDEYAGGRGAFDGRPAVASPFAALSVAVDALPYGPAPAANTGDHGGGDTQDSVLVHALAGRGPSGRRTIHYFDDVRTPLRETADFQLVQSFRQAMADLGDCLAPSPVTCRHANHVNVFTSLGAAPNQTIGQTRGGVDRGSYNQIVELAPTLFSVNVSPPGQSGFINAALLAQIEAAQ